MQQRIARALGALLVVGCGGSSGEVSADPPAVDASIDAGGALSTDAAPSSVVDASAADTDASEATDASVDAADADPLPPLDAGETTSAIKHVVLIVQENHTFDSYFGR